MKKLIHKFYHIKNKCKCSLKKIFMCNSDCITNIEVDITPVGSPKLETSKRLSNELRSLEHTKKKLNKPISI